MDEAIQPTPTDVIQETEIETTDEMLGWAEQERRDQIHRARQDLRASAQRLTEQQIALVAEVMADVRMLSIKLRR